MYTAKLYRVILDNASGSALWYCNHFLIMRVSLNPTSPAVVGYLLLDFLMSEKLFFLSVCWDFDNSVNTTRHSVFLCTQALVQSTALSKGILLSLLV